MNIMHIELAMFVYPSVPSVRTSQFGNQGNHGSRDTQLKIQCRDYAPLET
jgi:hypothetical protein